MKRAFSAGIVVAALCVVAVSLLAMHLYREFTPRSGVVSSVRQLNYVPELSHQLPINGEVSYRYEKGYKTSICPTGRKAESGCRPQRRAASAAFCGYA